MNFRGIDKLEIHDLKRINLFLGMNNCGKTTILESIFLLTGISNHTLPETINGLRSNDAIGFQKLKYLYHNSNMQNSPHFQAKMDDGKVRELEVSVKENLRMKRLNGAGSKAIPSTDDNGIAAQCLSLQFYSGEDKLKKEMMKSEVCLLNGGEIQEEKNETYNETITARFITSYSNTAALNEEMSSLIKKNKKQEIIRLANIFDSTINNIEVLPDSLYVGFEGVSELIPIGLCGEGLKKYLYILVSAANASNNILLIDEIENGIHFSLYSHLWKSIINLAERNDLQIMVTTHNIETIAGLSNLLENDPECMSARNDVSVYTVSRTKLKGLQSYSYLTDGLKNILDNQIEIRK